jgi:hypothetical protein
MRAPSARRREADKRDSAAILRKPRHFRREVRADVTNDFFEVRLDARFRGGTKKASFHEGAVRRQFSWALRGAESSSCGETSKSRFRAPAGDRSTAPCANRISLHRHTWMGWDSSTTHPVLSRLEGILPNRAQIQRRETPRLLWSSRGDFARWIDRCWRASFRVGFSILYVRRERVDPWGGNGRRKAAAADGGNETRAPCR